MPRLARRAFVALAAAVVLSACSGDSITGPNAAVTASYTGPHPILFVHGWNSSGSVWTTMIGRFQSDGFPADRLYNWSYNTAQSNATTAQQLSAKVDEIMQITGAPKVDLVTHSMGGLSARYYTKYLGGAAKVDAWVSLAGPNHGTNSAALCLQTSCREMLPNSDFLRALNRKDETPGVPRYATWWSPCDEVINPQTSTSLKGASNSQTVCMRHSDLHENATVYAQVRDWVGGQGAALVASAATP